MADFESAYWDMVYRRYNDYPEWHVLIRAKGLEEKNYHQAAQLMEYDLCWRVVGDTVYLDAKRLKDLILERNRNERPEKFDVRKYHERRPLSTSKYL